MSPEYKKFKINDDFYYMMAHSYIEHFIRYQIPFRIVLVKTQYMEEILPSKCFVNGLLILDARNWTLETMTIDKDGIHVNVAIGETPYSLIILPNEIIQMVNLESGLSVCGKFYDIPLVKEDDSSMVNSDHGSATINNILKIEAELDPEAVKKSMSSMKLLKKGE